MSTVRDLGLRSLLQKAAADETRGLMSLTLLLDHPAGIGDHSTEDYYKNLDEALDLLVDARDRIETLKTLGTTYKDTL